MATFKRVLTRTERFQLAGLAILGSLLRLVLAFRSEAEIAIRPYVDDAFYVFSISKHIARGLGPSVDGVTLTNGFQPLIGYVYAVLFWMCGDNQWLAVRLSFIVAAIIFTLTIFALARLIRALEPDVPQTRSILSAPVIGALIWTLSISIFQHTTNGLETGLYSLFLVLDLLLYTDLRMAERPTLRQYVALGLVLGLTVLTRIDSSILVAILCMWELLRKEWKGAIAAGAVALLVSAPWWIFSYTHFGSLMPISGQAENSWLGHFGENLLRCFATLTDIALTFVYAPYGMPFLPRIPIALAAIAFWAFLFWGTGAVRYLREQTRLHLLFLPYALFCACLIIYYTFFFEAPHFIQRYLHPLRVLWVLMLALALPLVAAQLRTTARCRIRVAVIGGVGVLALGFTISRYAQNFGIPEVSEFYEVGRWAAAHPSDRIGMLQSGTSNFVSTNIINLDGKVNPDALRAHKNGQLGHYIADQHFTYLADWKPFVEDLNRMALQAGVQYDSVARIGRIQVMKLRAPMH